MAAGPSLTQSRPPPRIEANARPRRWPRTWDWLQQGADRQANAGILAVFAAWAGLPVALWLAALGVVAGVLSGIFGAENIGLAHTLHVDEGVGVVGAFIGGIVGALGGFLLILVGYIHDPAALLGAILSGMIVAAITLAILVFAEPRLHPLRGYRALSRREKELLYPLLVETGQRMQMVVVPGLWISDKDKPAAWCHMRSIVVTRGLLGDYDASEAGPRSDLDRSALCAILAHELHHWQLGDAVGNAWVWSCFWPVVVLYNAATLLRERGGGWLGTLGWILFWPAWVTTKLIVVPIMATRSREYEFEADARAASLGDDIRLGLRRALTDLKEWEAPRTGWEDALAATHPSIELRLERLESSREPERMPAQPTPVRVPAVDAPTRAPQVPRAIPVPVDPEPNGVDSSMRGGTVAPPDPASSAAAAPSAKPRPTAPQKPAAKRPPRAKKPPDAAPSDAAAQWGIPDEKSDADDDDRQ